MVYTEREIKLETIRRSVEGCSDISLPANKERLIVECGRWWGTARQSAQAMLKELEGREAIVVDGQDVWSYERWQKILEARSREPKDIEIFESVKKEIEAREEQQKL